MLTIRPVGGTARQGAFIEGRREGFSGQMLCVLRFQVEELFQELVFGGLQPTAVTFNTLIAAHCAAGSWLKAVSLLTYMLQHVSSSDIILAMSCRTSLTVCWRCQLSMLCSPKLETLCRFFQEW